MLPESALKDLLHQQDLTKTDRLLLCLAVDVNKSKSVQEIEAIAVNSGLRAIQRWNVSDLLRKSRGLAIRTAQGWELTSSGKERVQSIAGAILMTPKSIASASLRTHIARIKNQDVVAFVDEAIKCLDAGHYRAAVVLSWVGALALLYDHVVQYKLMDFNSEASRRNLPKWKDAKTSDDLARMKEHDFLQILEAISIVGKSVKQELEKCLDLRNGCGHPNSLQIGENRVSAHIEVLIQNVFSRFAS